jgi:hypothetical protein
VAALSCLVIAVAAGCDVLGSDDVPETVQGPELLTRAQVDRYPSGSPARAFLEWWRAMQFDNATVAARYYSEDLGMTAAKVDNQLRSGANPLGLNRRPRLVDVEIDGDEANVMVVLSSLTRNPNGRLDKVRTARGFNLVREGGSWKLAENLYIERAIRVQKEFAEAIERSQRQQGQQ